MKRYIRVAGVMALGMGCGLSGVVSAQDARLADQTLHCAVWMVALHAVWADSDAQAARLERAARIFLDAHAKASGDRLDGSRVETLKQALQVQWRSADALRAGRLREDAIVCGAWAEGFLAQGETYRYVPVYPKIVAPSVRAQYGALADRALHAVVK